MTPTATFLFRSAMGGVLLLCLSPAAPAQLPALDAAKATATPKAEAAAAAAAAEAPDQTRKRLATWIVEWRAQAEKLEHPGPLPAGITANEVAERRSDLLLGVFTAENTLRALDTTTILQQSLAQAKQAGSAWKGFEQAGPYSFAVHDELRRHQEGVATRMTAYESAVTMLERELAKRQDDIKKADEAVRRAQESSDRAAAAELDAAAWRLESAKLKVRALGSAAGMLQQSRDNTRLRFHVATHEAELLKRKVLALGTIIAFPEADLAQLEKSTIERRKEISRELTAIEQVQRETIAARQKTLATAEALTARGASASDEEKARLTEAEAQLRAFDAELETMANRMEITGARLRFLSEYHDAQMARKTLLTSKSAAERTEAIVALQAQLARASAFDSLVDVRRNATLSAIQGHEAQLSSLAETSPQRPSLDRLLAALRADLDAVERFGQDISSLHLDIGRWLGDAEEIHSSMTWGERFSGIGSWLWTRLKALWNLEVYRYDDKTEVDGQVITVKRGLTLGWLAGALLAFFLAYRAGSWLLKRGFKRWVAKGRVQQGQADTLRRWTRIAMGLALALLTLHILRIPLTAFAFLGGALAIGIGFGTQTLFKNFISGIIVLAERKVRVGDILEVDGVTGTVTTIDTRSSTLRSGDGREMIVPNSLLLEGKVINWTHDTPMVRRVVKVNVAYGSPTRLVSTVLAECATAHGVVAKSPEPQVALEEFGTDSLVFALYFWIDLRGKTGATAVASDLRFMIERRLAEAGIAFPRCDIPPVAEPAVPEAKGTKGA